MNLPAIDIDGDEFQVVGRHQALVVSKTHPSEHHIIEVDDDTGELRCSCRGFEIRKTCRHATKVRAWLKDEVKPRIIE